MVTVSYADDGEGTTAMTHRGNESVINAYIVAYIVENSCVDSVLPVGAGECAGSHA